MLWVGINIHESPYTRRFPTLTLSAVNEGIRRGVDGVEDKRVTIREAAILLGVSEGAVRKRVDRGTLKHDKGEDGRVYVYLSNKDRPSDNGVPGGDDNGVDASTPHESSPLISEMRSRIDFLEDELRRKDMILMNMTETMKALTASPEPRESPVSASEEFHGTHAPPTPEYPVSETQRKRSW